MSLESYWTDMGRGIGIRGHMVFGWASAPVVLDARLVAPTFFSIELSDARTGFRLASTEPGDVRTGARLTFGGSGGVWTGVRSTAAGTGGVATGARRLRTGITQAATGTTKTFPETTIVAT
jgi:hypothetical protein